MPEHRIKFRGGWERLDLGVPRRLILPVTWPSDLTSPIRLTRRFGRPTIDPSTESVRLELRRVPGLRRLQLNGVDLGPPPVAVFDWDVPLVDILVERNTLTLEVVPPVEWPEGWGAIALVIASKDGTDS